MIHVSAALLLDPELTPSAKLIRMLLQSGAPPRSADLEVRSGLSRSTILRALGQLETHTSSHSGRTVQIPPDLLTERRLRPLGRTLYGILQLVPGYAPRRGGSTTYKNLSRLAGASPDAVRAAVAELARTEWLTLTQANRSAPLRYALRNPLQELGEEQDSAARQRVETVRHRGEQLMKEYLSLLVDSREFEDNARPGFLENPLTDQRLELDRFYYKAGVAFEYNGASHHGEGKAAKRQRVRDYIKLGICLTKAIKLIVLQAEDLTLDGMRAKIGGALPLRDLTGREALADYLNTASREFRINVMRGRYTDDHS